jgi:hypothetical protein
MRRAFLMCGSRTCLILESKRGTLGLSLVYLRISIPNVVKSGDGGRAANEHPPSLWMGNEEEENVAESCCCCCDELRPNSSDESLEEVVEEDPLNE